MIIIIKKRPVRVDWSCCCISTKFVKHFLIDIDMMNLHMSRRSHRTPGTPGKISKPKPAQVQSHCYIPDCSRAISWVASAVVSIFKSIFLEKHLFVCSLQQLDCEWPCIDPFIPTADSATRGTFMAKRILFFKSC